MPRRRRIKLAYQLSSLMLLAASLHAPTAYSAPGDPPSGSPAGAVYQLPLEQGRSDAAPKGGGGSGGGSLNGGGSSADSSEGEAGSLYRTENNFGSSSRVPGVAATASPGGAGGGKGGGAGGPTGTIAGGAVAAETTDTGNTSVTAGIVLIAAIALLALAAGVLSRRFTRP